MKRLFLAGVGIFLSAPASSHEWTPTYPVFEKSRYEGVVVTTMNIFNKRSDARFYEIGLYDKDWNPIPFASKSRIVEVPYLSQQKIDIYVNEKHCDFLEYVCTTSRLVKSETSSSGINTKICSKV